MKVKALTVGLALAFPLLASAQDSSVTLYGNIDTAVMWTNNIGQGKDDYVGMSSFTGTTPSAWGLRGTEKLSDNLSAAFQLESGFQPDTGKQQQGGRLFGRAAWVGLQGDWGQLSVGRQYNMLFWSQINSDIMGPNAYGTASLDPYFADRRVDNSLLYKGTFDGFTFGATYGKGRDALGGCGADAANESACSEASAMLGYDAANWGVNVAYETLKFANSGGDKADNRFAANAWAKFDALKVGLMYQQRHYGSGDSMKTTTETDGTTQYEMGDTYNFWSLGAAYALTPVVTLDGSINYIKYSNSYDKATGGDADAKTLLYVARVKYALSKRTSVYASAAYANNSGGAGNVANGADSIYGPAAGQNQTSFMTGIRHSF